METILTPVEQPEEQTRVIGAAPSAPQEEHTRVLDAAGWSKFQSEPSKAEATEGTRVIPAVASPAQPESSRYEEQDEDEYDDHDGVAEALIRWVPPITAIICAAIALCGFVYYQFVL